MTKKLNVKGVVIPNDYKWVYNLFGMDSISPKDVEDAITDAKGDDINVIINSPGGDVFAGSEIYALLQSYAGNVEGEVLGIAASAASVIAMACTHLKIAPTAQMMIHNVLSYAEGDHRTMAQQSTFLHGWDKSIANAYRLKTGMSEQQLLDLMNKTTWMTAQEAVDNHFADEIMFDEENKLAAAASDCEMIPEKVVNVLRQLVTNNGSIPLGDGYKQLQSLMKLNQKGVDPMEFKDILASLAPEKQKVINDAITSAVTAATAELTKNFSLEKDTMQKKIDALAAQVPPVAETDEEIMAKADPKVRAILEKAKATAAAAAKAKDDAEAKLNAANKEKELRGYVEAAGKFDKLPVNAEEFGPILMNFAKADKGGYDKLVAILTAANNMVAQGKIMDTIGSSHGGEDVSAWDKVQSIVKDSMIKDKTLTYAVALRNAFDANPDLYEQYRDEQGTSLDE